MLALCLLFSTLIFVASYDSISYKCYYESSNIGFKYKEGVKERTGVFGCSASNASKNGKNTTSSDHLIKFYPVFITTNESGSIVVSELTDETKEIEYNLVTETDSNLSLDLNYGTLSYKDKEGNVLPEYTLPNIIKPYNEFKTSACAQYVQEGVFTNSSFMAKFCLDEEETTCYTIDEIVFDENKRLFQKTSQNGLRYFTLFYPEEDRCEIVNKVPTPFERNTYANSNSINYLTFHPIDFGEKVSYKKVIIYLPNGTNAQEVPIMK